MVSFLFSDNIWFNLAPSRYEPLKSELNLNLECDLSRSLNVKSNGAFVPIYDFLLVSNSKHVSISYHLAVVGT